MNVVESPEFLVAPLGRALLFLLTKFGNLNKNRRRNAKLDFRRRKDKEVSERKVLESCSCDQLNIQENWEGTDKAEEEAETKGREGELKV